MFFSLNSGLAGCLPPSFLPEPKCLFTFPKRPAGPPERPPGPKMLQDDPETAGLHQIPGRGHDLIQDSIRSLGGRHNLIRDSIKSLGRGPQSEPGLHQLHLLCIQLRKARNDISPNHISDSGPVSPTPAPISLVHVVQYMWCRQNGAIDVQQFTWCNICGAIYVVQ